MRAVVGFRLPDVAYVGVEPYVYACTLYEARRTHVHQGWAVWDGDAAARRTDLGWASERYRLIGHRLQARREAALAYTRRPPESYVAPPRASSVRTEQRRLV